MTYSLSITRHQADPKSVNGLETWAQVTDYLRNKLDQWTTNVHIYKFSSNNKCLGEKRVTMSNICDVVSATNDKQILL